MKPYMLQDEVRVSAWFLLIGEKPMLHADSGQSGMIQQPNTYPTMFQLSGISELALLRWHPESVPAMPIALPPWANTSCGVEDSVSYSYSE